MQTSAPYLTQGEHEKKTFGTKNTFRCFVFAVLLKSFMWVLIRKLWKDIKKNIRVSRESISWKKCRKTFLYKSKLKVAQRETLSLHCQQSSSFLVKLYCLNLCFVAFVHFWLFSLFDFLRKKLSFHPVEITFLRLWLTV